MLRKPAASIGSPCVRMNFIPPEALPYRNPFGMTYDSGLYKKVFDEAAALADWSGFEARRAASEAGTCVEESASVATSNLQVVRRTSRQS